MCRLSVSYGRELDQANCSDFEIGYLRQGRMPLVLSSMCLSIRSLADQGRKLIGKGLFRACAPKGVLLAGIFGQVLLGEVEAQAPPVILQTTLTNATVGLTWSGSANSYEVQSAEHLSGASWRPMLITDKNTATVPMPGPTAFFRVASATRPATPMDEARRFQILTNITEKITSLPGTDAAADGRALADYLATCEEFIASGVTGDGSSWARFRDGRLVLIVNNRPAASAEEVAAISALGPAGPPASMRGNREDADATSDAGASRLHANAITIRSGIPLGIPESRNAVLFRASGIGLKFDPLQSLGVALTAHGYQVQGGEAGLFDLKNVEVLEDDIGLFYIDTHGLEIPGVIPFGMLTSTWADPETDAGLKEDFARGEVAYGYLGSTIRPKNGAGIAIVPKPLYCVLPPFVGKHWKFGRNSFVYMDVCDSAGDNSAPFIQACADAGASVYAGWTAAVDDWWGTYAAKMTVGTLLGGKEMYPEISPPCRPFDRVAVKRYLHGRRVDISPKSNAELVFFDGAPAANGQFGMLAPSIFHMEVNENRGELRLVGLFDPGAPATIRIEGGGTRELVVQPRFIADAFSTVMPTEIICPLPATQSPSAGYVTVMQRGHKSNVVPLTEYRVRGQGQKYFAVGTPDPHSMIDFQLHFRADVHRSRYTPYANPVMFGAATDAARDSSSRIVSASGTYNDPNGIRTVTWDLPSPIPLDVYYEGTRPGSYFAARSTYAENQFSLTIAAFARDGLTVTERFKDTGREFSYPFEPGTRTFPPGQSALNASTYTVNGGQTPAAGDSGVFNWESAEAMYAPNVNIQGYGE